MKSDIPAFLVNREGHSPVGQAGSTSRTPFLDRGIECFSDIIKTFYVQWETANRTGFFQEVDARIKVFFLLFFVLIVSLKQSILPEIIITALVFTLAAASRLNLVEFYRKVLLLAAVLGLLAALPSSLNIFIDGEIVVPIVRLPKAYNFWIYHVPQTIGITAQGLHTVTMLTLRVINSLSLSFLVVRTTPFTEIMRALKSLKVPDSFLMIMTLSYKYIFVFAKILEDIYLAKKSKTVEVSAAHARLWIAERIAYLFGKTRIRCEEIFTAMQARGFSGAVVLRADRPLNMKDFLVGSCLLVAGIVLLVL